mgnify:CR=1 FL=1
MPRLREIYVYPYVGWADRPWPGQRPRDSEEPWDDALLDLDAGARSARRVTESVSQALKALGVEAPRGQLMLELRLGDGDEVELEFLERFLDPSDRMTGRVRIPSGFRLRTPVERASMLGEAVIETAHRRAVLHGWDVDAVDEDRGRASEPGAYRLGLGPDRDQLDRHGPESESVQRCPCVGFGDSRVRAVGDVQQFHLHEASSVRSPSAVVRGVCVRRFRHTRPTPAVTITTSATFPMNQFP